MIALIAGTGDLPGLLADALVAAGDPPLICTMDGFAPSVRKDLQRLSFRIETLGTLLHLLRQAGVGRICMAGAVRRPVVDPGAVDALTLPLMAPLIAAMAKGDDGTLRGIIAILEGQGFAVIGADQIAPELLPPAGTLTRARPADVDLADAQAGLAQIAAMGRADTGQACVMRAGILLAAEGSAGTDAMLRALSGPGPQAAQSGPDPLTWLLDQGAGLVADAADWLSGPVLPARAGILVKAPKPGQDRRADLPVIGPQTARLAAAAGLAGIVLQAGGVMVIDRPLVLSILDANGMFLWVRP